MASDGNVRDPTKIQTNNEKKSGCTEGCKYGLIAIGIIFVFCIALGALMSVLGVNTYSSDSSTGSNPPTIEPTVIVRTPTTVPETVVTARSEKSDGFLKRAYSAVISRGLDLTIVEDQPELSGQYPYLHMAIVGVAKNSGKKTITTGFIEVKWFDEDGVVLGTSTEMVDNLNPGESMKFKVDYYGDTSISELDSYRIEVGDLYNI